MNLPQGLLPDTRSPESQGSSLTRLPGYWLPLARIAWLVIVVPTFVLFVANIPAYFLALHRLRPPGPQLFTGQLTPADLHTLQVWGVSLDFYAGCMLVVSLLFQLSYAAIGAVLFWRKSDDRAALLASFALMLLPFGFDYLTLQALPHEWRWLIPTLSALGNASIILCAYVLPDGRFAPRWIRWLALVVIGYYVASALLSSLPLNPLFFYLIFLGLIASTSIVQIYRYRYVSTTQQQRQTKWVVYGAAIAVAGNLGTRVLYQFVLFPHTQGSSLPAALSVILITFSMLIIPPTLGIAIFRSRLWDIDVIINRTLVYGALTVSLALVYVGLVIGLGSLVRLFTGQLSQSPVIIVASTLAIAALFQPWRRRLQTIIDRRFYRRKYDAAKTLAAFNATLRQEVDLDDLSKQLVTVVQEIMQPTHVSLWLRPPAQQQVSWRATPAVATEQEASSET